ncbi:MAG: P-II family nitrogen regulator [Erysipelotrichaceae bacterium]|nr:P-II family nitrogen regulator [Erysipelotrichaceae bacterium]
MIKDLSYTMLYVIVDCGLASKILHFARVNGVTGGTIIKAHGTVNNRFLRSLSLDDNKKEILIMVMRKSMASIIMPKINEKFKLHKPNRGIAYCIDIEGICGSRGCIINEEEKERNDDYMYQSIMVIIEKGKAEEVVEAAVKAGAKGATIINGRGSGVNETSRVFAMDIEPEKELVLIICKNTIALNIIDRIKVDFKIEEPGNGLIFVQNVSQVFGLID